MDTQENQPSAPAPKLVIPPTVGRRVWFWPHSSEVAGMNMSRLHAEQPMDAGIAFVGPGPLINISFADHTGRMHHLMSVPLLQDGDEPPADRGHCTWMPYQKGQAAKDATINAPIPSGPYPGGAALASLSTGQAAQSQQQPSGTSVLNPGAQDTGGTGSLDTSEAESRVIGAGLGTS